MEKWQKDSLYSEEIWQTLPQKMIKLTAVLLSHVDSEVLSYDVIKMIFYLCGVCKTHIPWINYGKIED